jgi:hypothetical protein
MKTNYQLVRSLYYKFKPVTRGILSGEEVSIIREDLCLRDMDVLQLRNLRDFTVLFFSVQMDKSNDVEMVMSNSDKLSGICAVIDDEIVKKGGEV